MVESGAKGGWKDVGHGERKWKAARTRTFESFESIEGSSPILLSNKVNVYFSFPSPCSIPPSDARQITRDQLWETLTVTRLHTEKGKGGRGEKKKKWNCWDRSCRFVGENRLRSCYGAWEEFFFFSFSFFENETRLWSWKGKFFNSSMHELAFVRLLREYLGIFYIMERWLRCLMDTIYFSKDRDSELKWLKFRNKSIRGSKKTCYRTNCGFDSLKFRILRNANELNPYLLYQSSKIF